MIRSMTGFGTAETQCDQWVLRVDVRSVNRKDLHTSFRLPDSFYLKESELQKLVETKVNRGQVTLSLSCRPRTGGPSVFIDEDYVRRCISRLRSIAEAEGIPCQVDLASLLSLPGAMKDISRDEDLRQELWPHAMATAEAALDALVQMRQTEGEALSAHLSGLCSTIKAQVDAVEQAQSEFVTAYRDRLLERVNRLLEGTGVALDEDALAREVAVYADRCDVSEEIERMRSHLGQFREALQAEAEPVGRRMEFLGQEMLREAGTTAAKVPAGPQVAQVLELKSNVDRLREQVRNVE